MNDNTRSILFGEWKEEKVSLPLFDLDRKSVTNGSYETGSTTVEDRVEEYLINKYSKEGYLVYKPSSGRLLFEKDGIYSLIYFIFDSESEREVWSAVSYSGNYSVFILRDRKEKEKKGLKSLTLDEAFDSFNFSSR